MLIVKMVTELKKISVAIVHPRMGRGGSEAVVMWAAEALKHDFDVSVITSNTIDLASFNSFYGTTVGEHEVAFRKVPMPRTLSKLRCGAAIRGAFFQRGICQIAHEYDVLFSAYNFCDCGLPAIHFLDLSWDEELRNHLVPQPTGFEGVFHRIAFVRAAYLWLVRRIARHTGRNLFGNGDLLLANSNWVASVIERRHGFKCDFLYPPVPGACADKPFGDRNDEFVCLGRISEEKRIERIISILSKVRARGYNNRLRIIGGFGANIYSHAIKLLVRDLPWVVLEGAISDRRKLEILGASRYGIHGAEGEAFGIAVAEMVRAGCITFACVTGGPAEILDHPALLYHDEDDAAEKIIAVLNNDSLREDLSLHLRRQGAKFSAENFMAGLHNAVERFIEFRDSAGSAKGQMRRSRSAAL